MCVGHVDICEEQIIQSVGLVCVIRIVGDVPVAAYTHCALVQKNSAYQMQSAISYNFELGVSAAILLFKKLSLIQYLPVLDLIRLTYTIGF